jgi:hypothetical protein
LRQIGREDLIEAMKADNGMISIAPNPVDDELLEEEIDEVAVDETDVFEDEEEEEEAEEVVALPDDFTPTEEFDETSLKRHLEDEVI